MASHEHFRLKNYKYLRDFGTARHGIKEVEGRVKGVRVARSLFLINMVWTERGVEARTAKLKADSVEFKSNVYSYLILLLLCKSQIPALEDVSSCLPLFKFGIKTAKYVGACRLLAGTAAPEAGCGNTAELGLPTRSIRASGSL